MKITFEVNVNLKGTNESEVIELLNKIFKQNSHTMAKIDDLNDKITTLQQTVNDEQQEIANALSALQTEIQGLKDIIAAGGTATDEQLQTAITNIDAIIEDVKTSIPNLPSPTPPAEG